MTYTNEMDITISYGDTFTKTFNLNGYTLIATDTITFSVKNAVESTAVLWSKTITGITGTSVTIEDTDNSFPTAVGQGVKCYDLLLNYDGGKKTLNFPAKLIVVGVAHSV